MAYKRKTEVTLRESIERTLADRAGWVTAADLARAWKGRKPTTAEVQAVRRSLNRLAAAGKVALQPGTQGRGRATTARALTPQEAAQTGAARTAERELAEAQADLGEFARRMGF